ncbi:hypothetical protein PM082_014846 [Marasmius tenuissimus]|nr:hypothetical protein PM082_014846 [Marasmius tenuissimus]
MPQSILYKAQGVSIGSGTFNSVQGDQHNHYNQIIQQVERKLTEFDDFRNLTGPDAQKAFTEEFLKLSRILSTEASQVYAIANGTIPSMVLWHNLIPLAQFVKRVGYFGQRYLESLCTQFRCDNDELWIDSSRGVICHGPKGPYSYLEWYGWEIKDLPPTAELLQEEVFMRFLASHKSKEADDKFIDAMDYGMNFDDVPERVDQPTIFSTLTKTPIAAANNVWESIRDTLVDRTCLENGWTRFRLNGDGELSLWLNWDVEKAWLSQAWSVLHARGVSLEDDQEGSLVYPEAWLGGNIDEFPSKCRRRHQQVIYLFVPPPSFNLSRGKTSLLHYWSFQEDGHSHLLPELCCDLGLPFELNFNNRPCGSRSWSTHDYKLIHQYQTLQGFDSTTTDFARHLGYDGNIFQPLDDGNRFREVDEDERSGSFKSRTDLGESVASTHLEATSDMQDLGPVTNSSSPVDLQVIGDDFAAGSQHGVANKRQRTDTSVGRVQTCTHPYQELYHKNSTTRHEQTPGDVVGSRPVRPLPRRAHPSSLEYSFENRCRVYSHGDLAFGSQNPPSHPFYHHPRIAPRSESMPSPIITLAPPYHPHPAACFRMPQNTATRSLDSSSPFDSYFSQDNNPDTTLDSAYADPSTYSVDATPTTSFTSDDRTPERVGWLGLAQDVPSSAVNTFLNNPVFYPISTNTCPSRTINQAYLPYSPHGPGNPSSFTSRNEEFVSLQYDRNDPVSHFQQQQHPVFSQQWMGHTGASSYGQSGSSYGYGGLNEWGNYDDGAEWQ